MGCLQSKTSHPSSANNTRQSSSESCSSDSESVEDGAQVPANPIRDESTATTAAPVEERSPSKPFRGDASPGKRERRVGYGVEGVREKLKKMAVVGMAKTDDHDFYAVSSSESSSGSDDEQDHRGRSYSGPGSLVAEADPNEEGEMIARALERSVVFRGIDKKSLKEVISAMVLVQVPSGAVIIKQGDLPSETDCIYLLACGEVDIVIAGGGQGVSTENQQVSVHRPKQTSLETTFSSSSTPCGSPDSPSL